ncbi:LruC domain-containing protein [Owenweeksia hongkongensis]|uniref:LruC domain-containing protein n=1 Tax=Owenweeksia hongkongensis TaxID=253245 RepID=UPI003A912CA0
MKNFLNIILAMCMGVGAQAQFSHTFNSSSTFSEVSSPWYSDPGCFASAQGYGQSYYDAVSGGIKNDVSGNGSWVVFFPVMDLQSGYSVKLTYSSSSTDNMMVNSVASSGTVNNGYSYTSLAAAVNPTTVTLNVSPNYINTQRLYLYSSSTDLTIYSVEVINATYSPGTGCTVTNGGGNTCADADSDGVCDDVDDYPNDPNKAYSSMVLPTNFMYEDLFPAYGDFDFNDLVVSAKREAITDADNDLRYLVVEAQVKAAGASIAQGWALELNGINPSDVVSVNGSEVSGNVMALGVNGTENGQTHAVIPVFDNVNKVITWGGGSFFNTVAGDPVGTGDIITVTIEFAKSSNLTVGDLDYNFFSFRTGDRSHEIHEIGMAPTSLADVSLFGTMADATNLNNGETYVSVDGLPWAISTSGTDYAVEKADIVEAFLKLAGWAQSGGTMYQDWHTNTTEGTYRNSAKIY